MADTMIENVNDATKKLFTYLKLRDINKINVKAETAANFQCFCSADVNWASILGKYFFYSM